MTRSKVAFADGNLLFNRSGMTVSQTAEVIAEILHGVSFGGRTEGVHWRWIETLAKDDSRRLTQRVLRSASAQSAPRM